MWMDKWTIIKGLAGEAYQKVKEPMGMVIFVLALVAAIWAVNRCQPSPPVDLMEQVRDQIEERIVKERQATEDRDAQLADELYNLRVEIDGIREAIAESVKEREEAHEAIDNADSVDVIDRILLESGRGGRTR